MFDRLGFRRQVSQGSRSRGARARRNALFGKLEFLEDRLVPTTVSNLLDAGVGSLRDAIATTPAGGTVDFQPALTGTITLTSGEIVIDKNLTILGPGSSSLAISGGNTSRIFDMPLTTTNVSISGLTLENGRSLSTSGLTLPYPAGWGGAIVNLGTLALSNDVITNSYANFGGGGVDEWGPLTVTNTVFSGNSTDPTLGGGGGAIYSSRGGITVTGSTFSGNSGQQGGAIINNSGTLSIDGSSFTSNQAGVGGGVFNVFGTGTITNSTFTSNSATLVAGLAGGGIANSGNSTLTVSGCTLIGNTAGNVTLTGWGGAIYNQDSTLNLSSSTLYGNTAHTGGGIDNQYSTSATVLTASSTTISGNSAVQGGGVSNLTLGTPASPGTLNAFDTIIAGNTAAGSPDAIGVLTSLGHNLIGNGTGATGYAATDLAGTAATPINPLLSVPANNGGPTQTMALLPGSPAINAGDNTGASAYDQRGVGFPRVVAGTIDIGAYEVQGPAAAIVPTVTVNPVNIIYGTALANSQLTGTSTAVVNGQTVNVAGTFTYTSAAGSILHAGTGQVESVTFTPTDAVTYSSVATTVTVNVQQATPLVTWATPAPITYGTALGAAQLNATASVSGSFTYTPPSGTVLAVGAQTLSATFTPTDTVDYVSVTTTVGLTVLPVGGLDAKGVNISATAGAPVTATVATFKNAEPLGSASTYSAVITWGDGTTSPGIITGTGATLSVSGTHTYANPGTDTIHVTITDSLGNFAPATTASTATVSNLGSGFTDGQVKDAEFWHSSRGQTLILSFNGGATQTSLATWLATSFPNIYGAAAGSNNLTGLTNADVAKLFRSFWLTNPDSLDVHVLSTALNIYATTSSLGGSSGASYGFTVSDTGLGARAVSVGSSGLAFGVANKAKLNVFELIVAVNNRSTAGRLYGGSAVLQDLAGDVFSELS